MRPESPRPSSGQAQLVAPRWSAGALPSRRTLPASTESRARYGPWRGFLVSYASWALVPGIAEEAEVTQEQVAAAPAGQCCCSQAKIAPAVIPAVLDKASAWPVSAMAMALEDGDAG